MLSLLNAGSLRFISYLFLCVLIFPGINEDEKFPYPIIEDMERKVASQLGMVDKDELDTTGKPLTARAVYIIDPNKKFRLSFLYPATTGRNFM